jgi:hypothetical protein
MNNIAIQSISQEDLIQLISTLKLGEFTPVQPIKINTKNNSFNDFRIKNIIRNDKATIVFWKSGDKTVVKLQDGDADNKENALVWAIAKKALGNKYDYYETIKKWCK